VRLAIGTQVTHDGERAVVLSGRVGPHGTIVEVRYAEGARRGLVTAARAEDLQPWPPANRMRRAS
jgi:hypothetical protein